MTKTTLLSLIVAACFGFGSPAPSGEAPTIPDFTKGDAIPAKARHDWNLGPTGLRGWMFCDRLVTTDARQIAITAVDSGSPADGVIAVGDVLLGAGGKPFSYDPRTELGHAITAAETEAGGGRLELTRWRAGNTEEVTLRLPVLGTFSTTAPYDCPKSQRILAQGLTALAARMAQPEYQKREDAIPRSLNALALLAGGDAAHQPLVKREAQWAADFTARDFKTWHYGYVMIFLAEYITATGDDSVLPGLRRLALEAAGGQSAVGSWGHTFALPDGRLQGYGMMNSPGLPLTIGMVLARDAGVKDAEVARAIELSARLLRFYTGKGAVPYGDHAAWTETHEDNGKCGMAAVLFNRLGEANSADYFTRMAVASHGSERDCGHTGNYFNLLWSLPAIAQAGPHATGAWIGEFGAWYHDLARRWDGTFTHQGPPEPDHDSYRGWDATGAYLLGYALPLKTIALTGRKPGVVQPLAPAAAQSLIADGRGWDNKDRKSFYDGIADAELIERLGSWSPIVRERAAAALARRKEPPLPAIIGLLDSPDLDARIGACHALEALRGAASPAVPQLRRTLQHDDLWLRVRAATALAVMGQPALPALPDMLERIARGPSPEDPRGMEQRFVSFAIFSKMLTSTNSLEGVDRDQLRTAIARGLQNQDGRARSEISAIYRRLSYDEIEPLLPAVFEAIVKPAPSGEMFADGVRLNGLKVLAQHHIEEGMQASADYLRTQNPWASEHRTPEILEILQAYGAQAQRILPHLRETAALFDQGERNFPKHLSEQKANAVREAIEKIEAAQDRPDLKRLK
ncbi:MAG: HEAT repeat domain-containing protein [Pirellulaceae bacterium]|nr:HEAT repeat domain-containing protein [Pirellulaceae bacterium]